MAELRAHVEKVRSKNAGPFWLTIDIFCGAPDAFAKVSEALKTETVAQVLGADPATLKRFDIADLYVVKISLPRPQIQGSREDRDLHGASWANLVAEIELD